MIQITNETVEKVNAILSGVPKVAQKALSNAINRGLSKVKTGAFKYARKVYTVQSGALNAATKMSVKTTSAGDLAGYVSFSGAKIPLYKFKVTPTVPKQRTLVKASVMKGSGTAFEHAFIADMQSGHTGVFERETSKRFPIEELMGLSAAQMIGNDKVIKDVEKDAQETVNKRIEHEIDRLLNGYGG